MTRRVYYDGGWLNVSDGGSSGALIPISSSMPSLVNVTPSATAHTKGAWAQVYASTGADVNLVNLQVFSSGSSGTDGGGLFDIAIGADGFEVPIVSNIAVAFSLGSDDAPVANIPVHIPSGSRVSVRWQSARASAAFAQVHLSLYDIDSSLDSPTSLTTIGADEANSRGTSLGSTSDTFVEIIPSTAEAYRGLVVCPTNSDIENASSQFSLQLGVGASFENVYTTGILYRVNVVEAITSTGGSSFIPKYIPSGTRLGVKYIDSNAGNTGYSVVLLGVPA